MLLFPMSLHQYGNPQEHAWQPEASELRGVRRTPPASLRTSRERCQSSGRAVNSRDLQLAPPQGFELDAGVRSTGVAVRATFLMRVCHREHS